MAVLDGSLAERLPVAGDTRDPRAREQTRAALPAGISTDLALAAVRRIFQAGLALEAAASLLPRPAATRVLGVVDDLDRLVRDIRTAVLKPPGIPAITAATPPAAGRAGELLDSVVKGIFTAGMGLQSAMGLPLPEPAAQRITEALRCLDEVIQVVRAHTLTEHAQQAQPGQPASPDVRERGELTANHTAALRARRMTVREDVTTLRQRVAQTAYALHLAAADTATLLERRGELVEQPGLIDYPTEIKRWRVLADQAKQTADRWQHL